MRNEPLVEITQVKGTSETHPSLSPNDEWAAFEIMDPYIGSPTKVTKFAGGYVREALLAGLEIEQTQGFNPFRFGFIGSSDTHNAAGPFEESRYFSKVGILDGTPRAARFGAAGRPHLGRTTSRRTTPRAIRPGARRACRRVGRREHARIDLRRAAPQGDLRDQRPAHARALLRRLRLPGRPRESPRHGRAELRARRADGRRSRCSEAQRAPQFLVWAMRDPHSGWLQRVQIVKGWVEDGKAQERVFDVACSDGLTPDATTHRCPDNGATVDLATCAVSENKGAAELRTLWTDPTFDPRQRAFYYVRVLENPTCRWSTWDAIRAGVEPNPKLAKTIQERAWSSPIWYVPQR